MQAAALDVRTVAAQYCAPAGEEIGRSGMCCEIQPVTNVCSLQILQQHSCMLLFLSLV
jgi:hypothetical protein